MSNAAEEVIKEEVRRKRSEWFDKECEEATLKKNPAYKEMTQRHYTRKDVENYKQLRREEKKSTQEDYDDISGKNCEGN
jgi:hypothetical protein